MLGSGLSSLDCKAEDLVRGMADMVSNVAHDIILRGSCRILSWYLVNLNSCVYHLIS
jgi:hypothetical protein